MSFVHSLILGGGPGGNAYAYIVVIYPAGAECTCSDGTRTLTAANTSGSWVFPIPNAGTWTVRATEGSSEDSMSKTITTQYQVETVSLSFLPAEYKQIQYIEGTGTQYIDLSPVIISLQDYIAMEVIFTEYGNGYVLGVDQNNIGGFRVEINNTKIELDHYASSGSEYQLNRINTNYNLSDPVYKFIMSGTLLRILKNGTTVVEKSITTASGYVLTLSPCIFTYRGNSGEIQPIYSFRLKSFEVTGKMKLIPVRRISDNVAGMWDIVNKRFLTNAGTGSFVAGGDV